VHDYLKGLLLLSPLIEVNNQELAGLYRLVGYLVDEFGEGTIFKRLAAGEAIEVN
jgi:hypothetical protein